MDRISISPGSANKSETQRVATTLLTTTGPEIELPIEDLFAELDAAVDFSDN
jgi:hypothetical protein